jgi:Xaa-Pro dipeptidase
LDLESIQAALARDGVDAWLFYDHHHRDPIAYRVLGLPEELSVSRRWFYVIPAQGSPRKLVHRVESTQLDSLPGGRHLYSAWSELSDELRRILSGFRRIAMQYSANNIVFYIGMVDAGTVELVRSFGHEIVSSGDLVAQFEATLSDAQIESHFRARDVVDALMAAAFRETGRRVRSGGATEYDIQQWIRDSLHKQNLTTASGHSPIVAVNQNSSDPHYDPCSGNSVPIREGDFVLLDISAKENTPDAVFYDVTWTGVVGEPLPQHRDIFAIVAAARDVGISMVQSAISSGRQMAGWEVDQVVREFIDRHGHGDHFIHRTGHSIATQIHANGPNMDSLEIRDDRKILPNSCFSIEPGIYLRDFGVRSEVNVLVTAGSAEVTGRIQTELVVI